MPSLVAHRSTIIFFIDKQKNSCKSDNHYQKAWSTELW